MHMYVEITGQTWERIADMAAANECSIADQAGYLLDRICADPWPPVDEPEPTTGDR
jgi:hypothetical protein